MLVKIKALVSNHTWTNVESPWEFHEYNINNSISKKYIIQFLKRMYKTIPTIILLVLYYYYNIKF